MSGRDDDKRLTVPKFSSFKSSESAKEPAGQDDNAKSKDRESRPRSRRSGKRHQSHHSSHHRHESHRRQRSRTPKSKEALEAKPLIAPTAESVPGVFIIDTKGDPLISKYGGIDRSKIPSYYRYGAGRVMGTDGRLFIHRDGPRDQASIRMPGEGSSLREKDGLGSKRVRFASLPAKLRKRNNNTDEDADGEFLSVNPKKRKHEQEDSASSDEDELPSYRAIEGKPKYNPDLESDDGSESGSSIHASDQDNPLKQTSIRLNRRVKDQPEDIDAWLELVHHQDALLGDGESLERKALDAEAHSFTEIKVSMLESALSNTTTPEDRSRVLVYLMQEGVKVWSGKTTAKKWAEVLKDEEGNFLLWRTRLDFSMSNIASFRFDEVKTMLLDRLRQALSGSKPEPLKAGVEEAIYIFLRATRFIHDAGYKELAVAAWQGILELNFFRPSHIVSPAALDAFRDFWESEAPRIGDADAQGWQHYVQSGGFGDAPEPAREDTTEASPSRDPFRAWGSIERLGAQKARMPARTMDEGTEDDPFRVVMYSDIEPMLFLVPDHLLSDVSQQLVDAFLLFCGLPAAFRSSEWTDMARHDQFLTTPWGGITDKPSWERKDDMGMEETSRRPPPFTHGEVHASISTDMLFSGSKWFGYLAAQNPGHTVDRAWVLAATRQLVHLAKMEDLAPIYMALCFSEDPANIRKPSKALLKKHPTNIQLYYAYALSEYSNGKPEVASNVLRSAMDMTSSVSDKSNDILFWRTWSWMELDTGNLMNVTKRLCSSVDDNLRKMPDNGEKISSAYILKAHRNFSSGLHESMGAGNLDRASAYAECLVLLSYLTADGCAEPTSISQGNISAAMAAVETISQEFKSWRHENAASHERVLQFAGRLLYFNASKGPFRRGYMQEQLSKFIDAFPQNTVLLSLFEWSDSSLRVIDETRSLLYEKVLSPSRDCTSSRIFAIRHELARGNTNSTKAAFEHAVSSNVGRGSVSLWVSYIRFSASQRELRGKAKDVFYRALSHCPWSKEVMMEAFRTLGHEMGSDELRAVHDTMASKGLRIHVDLDQFLEKWRGASKRRR